jgi:hypothetical protein
MWPAEGIALVKTLSASPLATFDPLRCRRALSWTALFIPLGVCPSLNGEFQSATRRPVRINHDSAPIADFALK